MLGFIDFIITTINGLFIVSDASDPKKSRKRTEARIFILINVLVILGFVLYFRLKH